MGKLDFLHSNPVNYLIAYLWRDAFSCPRCHGAGAWPLATCHLPPPRLIDGGQRSTRDPHLRLLQWFWAAYLMSAATPGSSTLPLKCQFGPGHYGTAWTMIHKLRRAMVAWEQILLTGKVEVDECWFGSSEDRSREERINIAAMSKMAMAVQVRDKGSGRVRMQIIQDTSVETLETSVTKMSHPVPSSTRTGGWVMHGFPRKATSICRTRMSGLARGKLGTNRDLGPPCHQQLQILAAQNTPIRKYEASAGQSGRIHLRL